MKTALTKLSFIPIALIAVTSLSGCIQVQPSPTARYTGNAVVRSHSVTGSSCNARVEVPGGKIGTVTIGKKSECTFLRDGTTIRMENGNYRGKL